MDVYMYASVSAQWILFNQHVFPCEKLSRWKKRSRSYMCSREKRENYKWTITAYYTKRTVGGEYRVTDNGWKNWGVDIYCIHVRVHSRFQVNVECEKADVKKYLHINWTHILNWMCTYVCLNMCVCVILMDMHLHRYMMNAKHNEQQILLDKFTSAKSEQKKNWINLQKMVFSFKFDGHPYTHTERERYTEIYSHIAKIKASNFIAFTPITFIHY